MKIQEKEQIAGTVGRYLLIIGVMSPTFEEFDKAWYELHKTRGLSYPDVSLRIAKEVWRLSDIVVPVRRPRGLVL